MYIEKWEVVSNGKEKYRIVRTIPPENPIFYSQHTFLGDIPYEYTSLEHAQKIANNLSWQTI